MSEELETARRYRLHAEELRVIAQGTLAEPNRHILLEVANDYEKMAKSLEALHESTNKTSRLSAAWSVGQRL
jgi:hypothetical protein